MKWANLSGRARNVLLCLGLIALVFFTFGRSLGFGFLNYDDDVHVWRNPYLFPWNWKAIAYFWTYPFHRAPLPGFPTSAGGVAWPFQLIYTPLSFMGLAVLAQLGAGPGVQDSTGLHAWPFHTANVLLHALNVVLFFTLLRRWFPARVAWISTAIFAIHPVQVEAVAWITGFNNLLATALAFTGAHLYLPKKPDQVVKPVALIVAAICFFLALLSKPSVAMFAPLVVGLDWYHNPATWKSRVKGILPWFVLAAGAVVLNSSLRTSTDLELSLTLFQRPVVAGDSLAFYLSKMFRPFPLEPDYGRRPAWVISHFWGYLTGLLPLTLTVYLVLAVRKGAPRGIAVGSALAFGLWVIALLPTSGIVPYYFQSVSTVADRYLYLALIPASWCVALHMNRYTPKTYWVYAVLFVVLVVRSTVQTGVWSSDRALWSHTLQNSPRSWLARLNMANIAAREGNTKEQIRLLKEAVELRKGDWLLNSALADALYDSGQKAEAKPYYKEAILAYGGNARSRARYGELLEEDGDIEGAAQQYYMGTTIDPKDGELAGKLGTVLVKMGQFDKADGYLRQALNLGYSPEKVHLALGVAAGQQKQFSIAVDEFQQAAAVAPTSFEAKYNLALALQATGRISEATRVAEAALTLKPNSVPAQKLLRKLKP